MKNPVVHRSVRMIAEAAAAVPWLLYDRAAELDRHPLLELLARPNPRQAGGEFLRGALRAPAARRQRLCRAGGRWRARCASCMLLRPDRVSVVPDATGWPAALEYRERAPSGARARPGGRRRGPRRCSSALFHPLDDHYGFPPLEAALTALDMHNAAGALEQGAARQFGAAVRRAGLSAAKDGGNLSEEQFERLRDGAAGRIIPAPAVPGGRCCSKAGSTGRR